MRHAARPQLLRVATNYGSILLAVFGSILLSAAWDNRWGATLTAVTLAVLPQLWLEWLPLPRQLGHAARGLAVLPLPHGIACGSETYAKLVARNNQRNAVLEVVDWPRWHAAFLLGPILALVLTPCLHPVFFPLLRVVNFTDRTIQVWVDDRKLGAAVEPTSGENPAAGETMRVPSGKHRLRATLADGSAVSDVHVRIRSGFHHLYAPAAAEDCFYLQRVSYGRSQFDGEQREEFRSASRFWIVPNEVDLWFTPEKSVQRSKTTGGVVTLLRMGACR